MGAPRFAVGCGDISTKHPGCGGIFGLGGLLGFRVEFRAGYTAVPENSMWFWGILPMGLASFLLGNQGERVYIYYPGCRISATSGVNVGP